MAVCTLGQYEAKETGVHSCLGQLTEREALSSEDLRLLKVRGGCKKRIKNVCEKHRRQLLATYASHQTMCCNPLEMHGGARKKVKTRSLKEITLEMRDKGKSKGLMLTPGQKLCVTCSVAFSNLFSSRKQPQEEGASTSLQSAMPALDLPNVLSSPSLPSSSLPGSQQLDTAMDTLSPQVSEAQVLMEEQDESYPETLDTLDAWLKSMGKTGVKQSKLSTSRSYLENVLDDIREVLEQCSGHNVSEEIREIKRKAALYQEMLDQLKDFFKTCKDKNSEMLALSVLPKSLSISRIKEEFPVSSRRVRRVKLFVEQNGILGSPGPKQGKKIPEETVELVQNYFYRMDVSRELPGKRDVISVRVDGKRIKKRKRLVLGTLSKLHEDFLSEHESVKISISKFASLRPKECVLAGSSGTHIVCVCTYHQNPKLMFNAASLYKMEDIKTVSDCLRFFLCEEAAESCHLRICEKCPEGLELQEKIELYFAEEMIESVNYNQWKSTDRGEMETVTSSKEKFVDDFIELVEQLVRHSFIAYQQAMFYNEKLESLGEGEIVVNADFAENYTYVVQESSQGHYFSNTQATIHPFMCYARKDGEVIKLPFVVISDCTDQHDTAAFSCFQVQLIKYLKLKLGSIKKIYYFSDGSAAQYKNKKSVANTYFHLRDFGIPAEWHFFATSHGKCACDGLGGTVKRTAYRHSLRASKAEDLILNSVQLFAFCEKRIKSMCFSHVSSEDVHQHTKSLEFRFQTASDIEGIKSSHAIIPSTSDFSVLVKVYSNATHGTVKMISTRELKIPFSDVRGFIIYSKSTTEWSLGYVNHKNEETHEVDVTLLTKTIQKFSYEFGEEEVTISYDKVLLVVEPKALRRGQVYKLLAKDVKAAEECLKNVCSN